MNTFSTCPWCMGNLVSSDAPCPTCGRDPRTYEALEHQLQPGTVLAGRYLIGRVLGQGGFGITYLGLHLTLKLRVAVKEYFPPAAGRSSDGTVYTYAHDDSLERGAEVFLREAQAMSWASRLPAVATVHDFFAERGTAYLVMEYVEGLNLGEWASRFPAGRAPSATLLPLMRPIAQALSTLHDAGVVHRDISPSNIMVDAAGTARLIDFGLARDFDATALTTAVNPKYAPVEQWTTTDQGPWTDVYAFCATLYTCLTGTTPPPSVERLANDALVPPRALGADIDARQEAALLHGLAPQPKERTQSMGVLMEGLFETGHEQARDPKTPDATEEAYQTGPQDRDRKMRHSEDARQTVRQDRGQRVEPTVRRQIPVDVSGPHAPTETPAMEPEGARPHGASPARGWVPYVAMAVVCVAALVVVLVALTSGGNSASDVGISTASTEAARETTEVAADETEGAEDAEDASGNEASDESRDIETGDVSRDEEADVETQIEVIETGGTRTEEGDDGAKADDAPPIRPTLRDYTWEELSEISDRMQRSGSRGAALDVARTYNLVASDGSLGGSTIPAKIEGVGTAEMRLIDIMHDQRSDGGGAASMTFLATNIVGGSRMGPHTTSVGGWEASEMRELLNDSLYLALSDDVRSAIVSVDKLSNNVGSSSSTNCVSTTHDRLWLPSIVELCGPVNWEYFTNPAGADLYNQVFNGEGSQYAYFASCDIDDAGPNAVLALGDQWWLRSSAASTGRGRFVGEGGDPSEFGDSNVVRGVVFGFCV